MRLSPPLWTTVLPTFSLRRALVALGLTGSLFTVVAWAAPGATVTTPQVKAELVAHAPEGVATGKPLWLGLKLEHAKHWHTYWKNPGDSGLPTTLQWTLPAGVSAGDIAWPTPKKLPIGPLMNFGYEGTLLLPVAVTVPAEFKGETLNVALHAEWLVCKEVCIPESGDFTLKLPAQAATAGHAALFSSAQAAQPQAVTGLRADAAVEGDVLTVQVSGLPPTWQNQALTLLPEMAGVLQNAVQPTAGWQAGTWTARLPLDPQRSESPASLALVLTTPSQPTGLAVTAKLTTPWPAVAAVAAPALGNAELQPTTSTAPANSTSLAAALGLALLGGLLLNLMPCVFPVLSLKVLGFAHHAHDRRALLAGGLAYTVGVVLSFMALAGLLLALRAGGEELGWGFQLQSPPVVAGLAALFTLIGLNLAGSFEFGSFLPSRVATAQAHHPLADSLLTGVLAVAVASPCTAPFMGASLGAAVALPTAQALAVFAVLGLGMALPYLAASAFPALARTLPRPGVWMQHFKTLMAFPMFATVVWLLWVLGQQTSLDAAAAWLATLVVLALLAWAWGSPTLGPTARRGLGALALLLMGATLSWSVPALREVPHAPETAGEAQGEWAPWSPARVAALQAQGRPVFVDFTAAWCVTCQVNKRGTLADADVKAAFATKRVGLLRADWTRRDPAITAELARLGRSGVPVYALYAPGTPAPKVLSELLSVREVTSALADLP